MQCNNCGRERPRTGSCPHCGAAAASSSGGDFSSLRGWREQSQGSNGSSSSRQPSRPLNSTRGQSPGNSSVGRRSPSDSDWGSPNSSGRRGSPSSGRRGDPGQSYGRRDDRYDDPDDQRALMLSPGAGGIMPASQEGAFPALPTEEEERALGIRRPAFIPATEKRTGKRPGRWRVISGVASITLFVLGLCAVSGLLVKQNVAPTFAKLLGLGQSKPITTPVATVNPLYLTPAPLITPVANAKAPIQSIVSALLIDGGTSGDQIIPRNPSNIFTTKDTINIVVTSTTDIKQGDTFDIQWKVNDVNVTPDLVKAKGNTCCTYTVQANSQAGVVIAFHLDSPQPGYVLATILYNKAPADVVAVDVIVPAATPTPAKGTVVPTATPKK